MLKKPTEDKKRKADDIDAQVPPSKKQKTENGGTIATGSTTTAAIADEDKDITKIFVGNLSFKVEEDNMREVFKDAGENFKF